MEEALIKRIMPNNLEAEQSVICFRDIASRRFLSSAVWCSL